MCDSTVLPLRKSSAAISRFVFRSVASVAISNSRLVRAASPLFSFTGRRTCFRSGSKSSQLAACLVAHAQRATLVELTFGPAQHSDRLLTLTGGCECAPLEAARERHVQLSADCFGGLGGSSRHDGGCGRFTPREQHRRARATGQRRGELQPELRSVLFGAAGVGIGRLGVPDRKLDHGQAFPVEAALHRHRARDLFAAQLEEDLSSPLDLAGVEPGHAEPPARTAAAVWDRATGQTAIDAQALLEGGDRAVEIP